jgi:hypothetical protein
MESNEAATGANGSMGRTTRKLGWVDWVEILGVR